MSDKLTTSWLVAGKLAALWKSTVSGSVIGSILGFSWTEARTGDMRFAFLVACASGAIGAICATIPRLILALKEARESASRIHLSENNNLISRIHELHKQETDSLKEAAIWAQNQAALTRLSKHAALSECYRLGMRCVVLENALAIHGHTIPVEAKPLKDLHAVLAEEDTAIRTMVEKRIVPRVESGKEENRKLES